MFYLLFIIEWTSSWFVCNLSFTFYIFFLFLSLTHIYKQNYRTMPVEKYLWSPVITKQSLLLLNTQNAQKGL